MTSGKEATKQNLIWEIICNLRLWKVSNGQDNNNHNAYLALREREREREREGQYDICGVELDFIFLGVCSSCSTSMWVKREAKTTFLLLSAQIYRWFFCLICYFFVIVVRSFEYRFKILIFTKPSLFILFCLVFVYVFCFGKRET